MKMLSQWIVRSKGLIGFAGYLVHVQSSHFHHWRERLSENWEGQKISICLAAGGPCWNAIRLDAILSLVLPWHPLVWQGEENADNTVHQQPYPGHLSTAQQYWSPPQMWGYWCKHKIRKHFHFLLFLSKIVKCFWGMHREEAGLGLLISPQCKEQAVNSFRRDEMVSSSSCIYSSCTGLYQSPAIFTTLVARWLCEMKCFTPRCRHKEHSARALVFWWPDPFLR